jgi:hypothetical protein
VLENHADNVGVHLVRREGEVQVVIAK